jgi:hypothetical protein
VPVPTLPPLLPALPRRVPAPLLLPKLLPETVLYLLPDAELVPRRVPLALPRETLWLTLLLRPA